MCFPLNIAYINTRSRDQNRVDPALRTMNFGGRMQDNLSKLNNIIIVTGHFGAGKTNFAVNLAKFYASNKRKVTLVDLDIVNPYFRAADNRDELEALGVRCIIPEFANTNVDIPTLPPDIYSVFADYETESSRVTIFDVGGDNGAAALGMYADRIKNVGYDLIYCANCYRPLTESPEDALEILREVEYSSRLIASGIVNTSNLGDETTSDDIKNSLPYIERLCELSGLPLICNVIGGNANDGLDIDRLFCIDNATKKLY